MFHKLAHMAPSLHSTAHHIVESMDHPVAHRHLRITYSSMKYSDKTFMGMTTSGKNAEDVLNMCAVLFGTDFMEDHAVVTGNCNGNSPLVWDVEQCAMGYRMAEGIRWDDFDEALSAVRNVGPGGHYLGHPHTLENFQRAFFMPELFDNNPIEQWIADCAKDITARALEHAKKMLDGYVEPLLDPAKDEALWDYINKREREIPAVDALNEAN